MTASDQFGDVGWDPKPFGPIMRTPIMRSRSVETRRFWIGFVLGTVLTGAVAFIWLRDRSLTGFQSVERAHPALPFPRVAEAAGLRVSLGGSDARSVVITRGKESITVTPPTGEIYDDPAITPDGRSLFLLVRSVHGFGYDYSSIVRFDFGDRSLSQAQPQRLLPPSQLDALFDGRRSAVTSLYKVSATGDQLLLNLNTEDAASSSHGFKRYLNRPYWYDIKTNSVHEPDF
jgi:hypothetical protein